MEPSKPVAFSTSLLSPPSVTPTVLLLKPIVLALNRKRRSTRDLGIPGPLPLIGLAMSADTATLREATLCVYFFFFLRTLSNCLFFSVFS